MTALPFLVLKLVVLYVYMSSLFPTRDDATLKPHDGEQLKNGEMKAHMNKACPNRGAKCIFEPIGCGVVCKQCEMAAHIDEGTLGHMLQMMEVIKKQQELSNTLLERVAALEKRCDAQDDRSTGIPRKTFFFFLIF